MSTREGHVSRVWDHAHWIPGEILPHFDPSHTSVAHQEAELEIIENLEQEFTCQHCELCSQGPYENSETTFVYQYDPK